MSDYSLHSGSPPALRLKGSEVDLMITCLCDSFFGDAAQASVETLEHLGCRVNVPEAQTCCGQPAFNSGDWDSARRVIRHTLKVFDNGRPVIIPSASCASMVFHGYSMACPNADEQPSAASMANRTWELCDFIVNGLDVRHWGGTYRARIVLHRSCHTRGSRSIEAALLLLRSIEGLEVLESDEQEQCCGFGGTFSVTFPVISIKMGELRWQHIRKVSPDLLVSLDMGCMLHMGGIADQQSMDIPRLHIAQVLRDAWLGRPPPRPKAQSTAEKRSQS